MPVRGGAQAPPDQQPAAPAGHQRHGQGLPAPVIPPPPLGPIAGTEPPPPAPVRCPPER